MNREKVLRRIGQLVAASIKHYQAVNERGGTGQKGAEDAERLAVERLLNEVGIEATDKEIETILQS